MQSHTGTVKSDKELTQCGHVLDLTEDVPQLTAFIVIFRPPFTHPGSCFTRYIDTAKVPRYPAIPNVTIPAFFSIEAL